MSVKFARSDISKLMFELYSRSVHPELYQSYAELEINHNYFTANISICDFGHVISVRDDFQTVTEVSTMLGYPLPECERTLFKKLQGTNTESFQFENGLSYQCSFHLEQLEPVVFHKIHEELVLDCQDAQVSYQFSSSNRFMPGPVSLIKTEEFPQSLLVHTYHTYPEFHAIVKTQSLFEFE